MEILIINSIDDGEGSIEHLIGEMFTVSENYEPLDDGTVYIETPEGVYPIKENEYKIIGSES